jgi:hypothetical protein
VRKRGGSYRASSNPWNGAGTPVGAMTGTGVITSATAECPRLDAGGSARSPSAVCVEWQQSQPRARPGPQLVAQQAAARSCAVSSLGAASATWALSAAATTATNAERIPFRRTDITLPPAMSRHKRGFLPARRPLLESPASVASKGSATMVSARTYFVKLEPLGPLQGKGDPSLHAAGAATASRASADTPSTDYSKGTW